jgi:hypothetical protein
MPGFAFPPVGPLDLGSPPYRSEHICSNHRYYAPLRLPIAPLGFLRFSLVTRYLALSTSFVSRLRLAGGQENSLPAPGLLFRQYPSSSGFLCKETIGSPKFPSRPFRYMPRSQTPVVSSALAIAHPGLLPSTAFKASAFPRSLRNRVYPSGHDYTHFEAQ